MLSCCKVCRAVIDALSAYVDWISVSYIYQHEGGILLQMLCIMLSDENLQLPASECLLIIANRRVSKISKIFLLKTNFCDGG